MQGKFKVTHFYSAKSTIFCNMHILIYLKHEVPAFSVPSKLWSTLQQRNPQAKWSFAESEEEFIDILPQAEIVLCWEFREHWYQIASHLRIIGTPAAGHDWIAPPPKDRQIRIQHGSFHGKLIAETLLADMLTMNVRWEESRLQQSKMTWSRGIYENRRMLAGQNVLILGYGNIGFHVAGVLRERGMNVTGLRRNPQYSMDPRNGVAVISWDQSKPYLEEADHIILLLPGEARGTVSQNHFQSCKQSPILYNYGRGGTLSDQDILQLIERKHLRAAVLDVCETEPLPADSPLWKHPRVFLSPHSSCCYAEYAPFFVKEWEETFFSQAVSYISLWS